MPARAEFQDRSARLLDASLPTEQRGATLWEDRAYMAGLATRAQADPDEPADFRVLSAVYGLNVLPAYLVSGRPPGHRSPGHPDTTVQRIADLFGTVRPRPSAVRETA